MGQLVGCRHSAACSHSTETACLNPLPRLAAIDVVHNSKIPHVSIMVSQALLLQAVHMYQRSYDHRKMQCPAWTQEGGRTGGACDAGLLPPQHCRVRRSLLSVAAQLPVHPAGICPTRRSPSRNQHQVNVCCSVVLCAAGIMCEVPSKLTVSQPGFSVHVCSVPSTQWSAAPAGSA